jgi:hypothetical protein
MANFVPTGLAGLLGIDPAATWEDRLREAALTSPKGTRIKFLYTAVARTTTLRGTVFEFPGVNDAYVQRTGFGPRRYPLRCIFTGKDHDRVATAFEAALLEEGLCKLEHPMYGAFNVVPFGDVERSNDLVEGCEVSVVEVTFWTTTGAVYPSSAANGKNEISASLGNFDVAAAQQFNAATDLTSEIAKANLKQTIHKLLREFSAGMQSVSDTVTGVRREVADGQRLINEGIDVLIGQPLDLVQQVANLIRAPSRALAGIQSRLDGYAAFAQRIFLSPAARPADALVGGSSIALRRTRIANDFHTSDLFAANAVAGSISSALNTKFSTRPQALDAAAQIADQFAAAVAWRDGGFSALQGVSNVGAYQVDPGDTHQALQDAVARAAGFLIQTSFTLAPERTYVLDRARTIIDVAAQLYGTTSDATLNLLIDSNNLTGSEILELPAGRRIKFYRAA